MKEYKIEVVNKNTESAIIHLSAKLLENKIVDAILLPAKAGKNSVFPTLIREVKKLSVFTLEKKMLFNSAKTLSNIMRSITDKKIAAFLRPCEIRATVELMKLKMVNKDNVFIIGMDCEGTYVEEGLRLSCRVCENHNPENFNLKISTIGINTEEEIFISTEENIAEVLNLSPQKEPPKREVDLMQLAEKCKNENTQLTNNLVEKFSIITSFLEEFSSCIKCYNCRRICPICYCKQCIFETDIFEHNFSYYEKQLEKKGAIKVPSEVVMFHLTRLNHMVLSCISCGMCSSVCPQKLPCFELFHLVGKRVQSIFNYLPGKNPEDELPLSTFREDEFKEIT